MRRQKRAKIARSGRTTRVVDGPSTGAATDLGRAGGSQSSLRG